MTAQTVLSASYGLHQTMYTTATEAGFVDVQGIGRAPSELFKPDVSLNLGSNYLASAFLRNGSQEDADYPSEKDVFFRFTPALRSFNAGFGSRIPESKFRQQCFTAPLSPNALQIFQYACEVTTTIGSFTPKGL